MKKILIWQSQVEKTMNGFIKRLAHGQKGFTLIELLVVVAILGVLAAVVMPNVGKFMGSGKTEAGKTELANVQLAMTAMMADKSITTVAVVLPAAATNLMDAFPNAANQLFSGNYSYVQKSPTAHYYSVDVNGNVKGWWASPGVTGGEIGVNPAP